MQMGAWNWEGQWGIERARKTALQGPGRCEILNHLGVFINHAGS